MNNEENTKTPNPTKPNQSLGQKKVFDVVRPGKSPASPTSRPVIIGHRPQVQDDQFVPSADSHYANDNPFDKHALMEHSSKLDLEPTEAATPTEATAKPMPPAPAEQENTASPSMPTPEESELVEDKTEPKASTSITVDAEPVAEGPSASLDEPDPTLQSATPKPPFPAESTKGEQFPSVEEPTPPEEIVSTLAPEQSNPESPTEPPAPPQTESEQKVFGPDDVVAATGAPVIDHAFVSHHKAKSKWWEWLLIFLLVVALGLVALNFLIDAEVIKLSTGIPHTNLIK
jgi:hypothetical protein